MDPLSISASIIAVLTLTAKTTSKIKHIIEGSKDAPVELIEVRDEILSLTWVVERLDAISKIEQEQDSAELIKLEDGSSLTDIDMALKSCNSIMKEIRKKVDAVQGYLTGNALERIKYPFSISSDRAGLRDLRIRLGHSKIAITIALQMRT